jgi:hypothetical protein
MHCIVQALLNNKRNYHNYRSLFLRRMKTMTATCAGSSEQVATPSDSMAAAEACDESSSQVHSSSDR